MFTLFSIINWIVDLRLGAQGGQVNSLVLNAHLDAVQKHNLAVKQQESALHEQLSGERAKLTPLPKIEGLLPHHSENHQGGAASSSV